MSYRFIYIVNCLVGEIIAYTRSTDGSITFADVSMHLLSRL